MKNTEFSSVFFIKLARKDQPDKMYSILPA